MNVPRLIIFVLAAAPLSAQTLESRFRTPPPDTRPLTYWLWMNGNVSREGITLDLDAMKRVGIGGVFMFDGGAYLPAGPVDYLSPQWRDLMQHTIREGARLGLDIGMHNGPGWSSSGGPWITPDRSMQQLVWSETTVTGPGPIDIQLPQPRANRNYYRDAIVLAFPAAPGETAPAHVTKSPTSYTLEYAEPFEARSVTVQAPFDGHLSTYTLEASDDGASFRRITSIPNPGRHGIQPPAARSFPPVRARFFRITGPSAGDLAEVTLHHNSDIDDWPFKANFAYRVGRQMEMPAPKPGDYSIDPATVLDLTSTLDSTGHLHWTAPAGRWTILRLGQTTTG